MSAVSIRTEDDDHEPLVVLNDDQFAALPAVAGAVAPALPPAVDLADAAQSYLRSQGITDPRTWTEFRLGQVTDADLDRLLTPAQRQKRHTSGIWLPTFDPTAPAISTGLVRLTPAQNKHAFLSTPAGIAAAPDIGQHRRIILCDAPLLALLLHQAGVVNVALVEDPAVLAPLAAWLRGREVVIAAHDATGLSALRSGLGLGGDAAQAVLVSTAHQRWGNDIRRFLGLPPAPPPPPAPEPSTGVLTDLHRYAESRLPMAEGMAALRTMGLDDPDLVRAYRIGFLPVEYRAIIPPEIRPAFRGLKGNCILLPAWDERGGVVDLFLALPRSNHTTPTLFDAPRGMLAPVLATACSKLVITDVVRRIGRLWSSQAPPLLLRGAADAVANAGRLATGGVRAVEVRVHRAAADIAAALGAVGITVTLAADDATSRAPVARTPSLVPEPERAPELAAVLVPVPEPAAEPAPAPAPAPAAVAAAPPPPLTLLPAAEPTLDLVGHDRHAEQATFRYRGMTISAQVPWGASTTLEVIITAGEHRHRDRLDLSQGAQRQRFASVAAIITTQPAADIAAALALVLPAVERLADLVPATPTAPADVGVSAADRDVALAWLRAPDLLDQIAVDLDALGWVGEADVKAMAVLAAISRLTPDPVWAVLTATDPTERFPGLGVLAAITPPEHLLHAARLTDNALANAEPDALRHKLLLIDDAAAVTTSVATALKVMRSQGSITSTKVERDARRGEMRTRFVAAHGPLAVITAATGAAPRVLRHHLVELPVDESQAQVAATLARRCERMGGSATASIIARLHTAQRLLVPLPVAMPANLRAGMPLAVLRRRLLQDAYVGFIAASAVLHQYQRTQVDGRVVATDADVALATRLLAVLVAATDAAALGLGRPAHALLTAMSASGRTTFAMADLDVLLPGWCRWSLRNAVDALVALEFVGVSRGGRGRVRTYTLASVPQTAPGISSELAGWRAVGGSPPANTSPEVACG